MPDDTGLPDFRFNHFALSVPDLAASIAWFGEKLGFVEELRAENPAIPAIIVFLKRGNLRVELFQVPGAAPLPDARRELASDLHTHGTKHVAFEVDDLAGLLDEFRRRDVEIVAIVERPWAKISFIRDNAGNLIEFLQMKPPA